MIIHVSPDASPLVQTAMTAVLYAHIGGASLGLASGPVALIARKGSTLHRAAGNVFFAAMLAMSIVGAIASPLTPVPDPISSMMGAFTFYLVATGWAAVKRRPGHVGAFETGALIYVLMLMGAALIIGRLGAMSPDGQLGGQPYQIPLVAAGVAALAATADLSVILRGGLSGAQRIARHLWRITLALFIAWGSFAGQPKAQPEALRGSPLLIVPALLVLAALLYWLARTLLTRRIVQRSLPA